jgi:hypothetical protein
LKVSHDEALLKFGLNGFIQRPYMVDIICTPTQIIHTNTTIPKPTGIYWDLLSPQKLAQVWRCRFTLSKPGLKAPRYHRLQLEYDELLSNFALYLELRRYTQIKVLRELKAGTRPPPPLSPPPPLPLSLSLALPHSSTPLFQLST